MLWRILNKVTRVFRNSTFVLLLWAIVSIASMTASSVMVRGLRHKETYYVSLWSYAMGRLGVFDDNDPLITEIMKHNTIPFVITNERLQVEYYHLVPDAIIDHPTQSIDCDFGWSYNKSGCFLEDKFITIKESKGENIMAKKIKCLCMVLLMVMLTFSFNEVLVEAATVKISKSKVTLEVGKTTNLKMQGTTKKVTWSSKNKKIATVNSSGKVKAIKVGNL